MKHEPITHHAKNYLHQVWLASLGTVSILQQEGNKLLSEFVEEGKRIEAQSKATRATRHAPTGSFTETIIATKATYQKKFEAQLADWDAQLDQLTAKAKQAKADARSKVQGEIDRLTSQRAALQNQLDELRTSSEAAWEDLKDGVEKAWGDISEALGKVVTRFH